MAVLAGARRLHCCIEGEKLGLTGDLLDQQQERADLVDGGRHRVDTFSALQRIGRQRLQRRCGALQSSAILACQLTQCLVTSQSFLGSFAKIA